MTWKRRGKGECRDGGRGSKGVRISDSLDPMSPPFGSCTCNRRLFTPHSHLPPLSHHHGAP
jgi:hypothetical protein